RAAARWQMPGEQIRNGGREQRLPENLANAGGLQMLRAKGTTATRHQDDWQGRTNLVQRAGELGSGHFGHDVVRYHQIETIGGDANGLQRCSAVIESDCLVTERSQHLFGQWHQWRIVVDDQDGLATAAWSLGRERPLLLDGGRSGMRVVSLERAPL